MSKPQFGHLITAMVTPFDGRGDVDFARTAELARRLVQGGTDSIVVCGTTGEGPTISHAQKLELFATVVEAVGGKAGVIANVGDNCTANSIDFACEAAKLGVDGLMCVVPFYNKPPQEGMYRHFKAIADSVDVPIVLYNIPGRCGVNMKADTTLALARDCANIAAVKEASGDLDQVRAIVEGAPEGFFVYSGDDSLTYEIMRAGGTGVISTISNVATARMKEIVDACAEGEWQRASELNGRLLPLMNGLFETTNPILVKAALELDGFDVGGVRLPLVDAAPEQVERLALTMRETGVLR